MDKFDMMLKAVIGDCSDYVDERVNVLGSKIGERREVTVEYAVGKEEYPEIHYEKDVDLDQRKEDAVALLYAAGKIFEKLTGAPKGKIGDELAQAATKSLEKQLLREVFSHGMLKEMMEDLKDE